jgi:orotate phosphoribosyltransferase
MLKKLVKYWHENGVVVVKDNSSLRNFKKFYMPIRFNTTKKINYNPKVRIMSDELLLELVKKHGPFDIIAGCATGGISTGRYIADKLMLPFIYVRPQRHNKLQKHIEGISHEDLKGKNVALIDDSISSGSTAVVFANILRKDGANVKNAFVFYNFERHDVKPFFEKNRLHIHSLLTTKNIAEILLEENLISQEKHDSILEWDDDALAWGKKRGLRIKIPRASKKSSLLAFKIKNKLRSI